MGNFREAGTLFLLSLLMQFSSWSVLLLLFFFLLTPNRHLKAAQSTQISGSLFFTEKHNLIKNKNVEFSTTELSITMFIFLNFMVKSNTNIPIS